VQRGVSGAMAAIRAIKDKFSKMPTTGADDSSPEPPAGPPVQSDDDEDKARLLEWKRELEERFKKFDNIKERKEKGKEEKGAGKGGEDPVFYTGAINQTADTHHKLHNSLPKEGVGYSIPKEFAANTLGRESASNNPNNLFSSMQKERESESGGGMAARAGTRASWIWVACSQLLLFPSLRRRRKKRLLAEEVAA
jgi:hypothetical protein